MGAAILSSVQIDAFFRREHTVMIPLTVREILDEHIARKPA